MKFHKKELKKTQEFLYFVRSASYNSLRKTLISNL